MKFILCLLLLCLTMVNSFHPTSLKMRKYDARPKTSLCLSENLPNEKNVGIPAQIKTHATEKYAPVPVDRENSESAAAVTSGILGFMLGGPLLGAIFAAVGNYVVKKDSDSGEALRGAGKTVVEAYNFLKKLNYKYNLVPKFTSSITDAFSSVAKENESLEKVKDTLSSTVSKVKDLNEEYKLVDKGKNLVSAAATLSDTTIDKVIELNEKYGLVNKVGELANEVVEKVRDNVKNSK